MLDNALSKIKIFFEAAPEDLLEKELQSNETTDDPNLDDDDVTDDETSDPEVQQMTSDADQVVTEISPKSNSALNKNAKKASVESQFSTTSSVITFKHKIERVDTDDATSIDTTIPPDEIIIDPRKIYQHQPQISTLSSTTTD
jgi:hypothetical protein